MSLNKIALFIDRDNILINMKTEPPEKLSEGFGYQRMMSWLEQYGEICLKFVFAPAVSTAANIDFFYELGFIPVSCLQYRTSKNKSPSLIGDDEFRQYERDETIVINKTDETMIDVAKRTIDLMPEVSHICIASADADFIPIVEFAHEKGKKVMIAFSSLRASKQLLRLADRDEKGKRMLHLFNPIREIGE